MSRLFYEDDGTSDSNPRFEVQHKGDPSKYLEKIAKLIPSEIIVGYITLTGFVPLIHYAALRPWAYLVSYLICQILTPFYMNSMSKRGKPKIIHIAISSFAFPIWAYAVSGGSALPSLYDPAVASMLLLLFTLISGAIPLSK